MLALQSAALRLLNDSNSTALKLNKLLIHAEPTAGPQDDPTASNLSARSRVVLRTAADEALREGESQIAPQHLLMALVKDGGPLVSLLFDTIGLDPVLVAGMLNELEQQGVASDEPDGDAEADPDNDDDLDEDADEEGGSEGE
jgi:ATP-dependent Clp protease ATP-binding subunit ClpA